MEMALNDNLKERTGLVLLATASHNPSEEQLNFIRGKLLRKLRGKWNPV